jgi:antitoxin HicB
VQRELLQYRIIIQQDEDKIYVAKCSSLPGCISQGKTRAEVLNNIKDAISGYLASLKKHNEPIPSIEEELIEVVPKIPIVSGIKVVKALAKIGCETDHQMEVT